jgi:hypothetical protein
LRAARAIQRARAPAGGAGQAVARYVVDEVREATLGGFYRVLGDSKRLK